MKKYTKDYSVETDINEKGKIVEKYKYIGKFYEMSVTKDEKLGYIKKLTVSVVIFITCFLIAGLLNTNGSRNIFIVLPYATYVFPALYLIMGLYSFAKVSGPMKHSDYDLSVCRMSKCINAIMVISAYLLFADLVFIGVKCQTIDVVKECLFALVIGVILFTTRSMKTLNKEIMNRISSK